MIKNVPQLIIWKKEKEKFSVIKPVKEQNLNIKFFSFCPILPGRKKYFVKKNIKKQVPNIQTSAFKITNLLKQ